MALMLVIPLGFVLFIPLRLVLVVAFSFMLVVALMVSFVVPFVVSLVIRMTTTIHSCVTASYRYHNCSAIIYAMAVVIITVIILVHHSGGRVCKYAATAHEQKSNYKNKKSNFIFHFISLSLI